MNPAQVFIMVSGFVILFFALFVALARWIFRINHIVKRLDDVIVSLKGVKL